MLAYSKISACRERAEPTSVIVPVRAQPPSCRRHACVTGAAHMDDSLNAKKPLARNALHNSRAAASPFPPSDKPIYWSSTA